tara:strand:+ start:21 stop:296 length:276 start_codon:yes stop_codon:yes gene_type:complete
MKLLILSILNHSLYLYDSSKFGGTSVESFEAMPRSAQIIAAIPEGAVVIPRARPMKGEWASSQGLSMQCPIIVKYRDHPTDASTELEQVLR